ncbi:tripartite tricarboxylate transporter permease [Alphaproteobacteria bacterium]|jgi:putative tricarboxylic transport membrane protein|nr:tripartite tricarboxylate transporter permease [Alphaproteobacteria bacterium]MDB9870972.1 tripartite tricarboxylate transporter permease [Alphaproteobacteria bacterium]
MIDVILQAGASVLLDPLTLGLMAIGTLAGLLAGAIPGFTIAMGVILTLPFTFGMSPIQGLATMMGVFVGGLSGGLMSGMLTGIPGTPSSVATTFDGFPLVRSGKPGLALGLGLWSSFFGGIISAIILVALAPQLAFLGLEFGPWDYFSLIVFALTITVSLSGENMVKGLIAGLLGLFAACVGEDEINGVARFAFGSDHIRQGFAFLPVLIGLFAFSQLLSDVEDNEKAKAPLMKKTADPVRVEHIKSIIIIFKSWVNLLRSSFIGIFTGILPAAGGSISNILAYDQAKKAAKNRDEFGKGAVDGIIAPESANNATAGGALIMMMALGIPGDIVTAVMLGALMIHNVIPGPSFIQDEPLLAYGIFIAFFAAHFFMLGLQAFSLRLFLLVTRVPMYVLASIILAYCAIGVFSLHNITFDIWVMFGFGVIGYFMRKLGFPLAPMILGVVLGKLAELNIARAVGTSDDYFLFLTRPWSLFFILMAVVSILFPFYQNAHKDTFFSKFYVPICTVILSFPLFMMASPVRSIIASVLLLVGGYLIYKRSKTISVT